jgi:5-(carboxyamino)imidazole ribonucleotide mutase
MSEPVVGVAMGSDSDLEIMRPAIDAAGELDVGCEVRVLSAHRTPDETLAWTRGAAEQGLRVIIAGAGGAAHLPGVVAAVTSLPVIGVPIAQRNLAGFDSLTSIAQMPPGVPVATVGTDAARNAGLLALRILAVGDAELRGRIDAFRAQQAERVRDKDESVRAQFDHQRDSRLSFGFH